MTKNNKKTSNIHSSENLQPKNVINQLKQDWTSQHERPVELPDEEIDMVQYYHDLHELNGKELIPKKKVNFSNLKKFVQELARPTLGKNVIITCIQYCTTEDTHIIRTDKDLKVCANVDCKNCETLSIALNEGFKNKSVPDHIKITMSESRVSSEELELIDEYFDIVGLYKTDNIIPFFTENVSDYIHDSTSVEGFTLAFINGKFYDIEIRILGVTTISYSEVSKHHLLQRIQNEIIFSYTDLDASNFNDQGNGNYVLKQGNITLSINKVIGTDYKWRIIKSHGRGSEQIFKGIIKEKTDFIKLSEMLELY